MTADEFRATPFGVVFTVYGKAESGGSKRVARFGGKATGRPIVIDDNRKAKPWKEQVSLIAATTMRSREPFLGPLVLSLTFFVERPASHFGKRGLKPSAPRYPTVKPDVTKLIRPLEDALTGIVWKDDAQIVMQHAEKHYGEPARVQVRVTVRQH